MADAVERFHSEYARRLGIRAPSFELIFRQLALRHKPLIIETGCLRVPGNWAGDGQSTALWSALADHTDGIVFSVDISPKSISAARGECGDKVHLILNDSVAALRDLARLVVRRVDLLYLDSMDLNVEDPMPSAEHHFKELKAAWPLLGPESLVCVDDYGRAEGGKGKLIDQFMKDIEAPVLFEGYQKIWQPRQARFA